MVTSEIKDIMKKARGVLLKALTDRRVYFHQERYCLFGKKLYMCDGAARAPSALPDATIHIVAKPEELDRLRGDGYDLHACPNLAYLKKAVGKKALLILLFVGKEFVHSTVVVTKDAAALFDPIYKDVRSGCAGYIGPCYTSPAYRGKGVYPFVLSRACRLLKDAGNIMAYISTKKTNEASRNGILKAGFEPAGETDLNKILFWKIYKKAA